MLIISSFNFLETLISCILMIIFSELGDKTFFITIILSAKFKKLNVFTGSIFALITMTIISVVMGVFLNQLISKNLIKLISFVLYAVCGIYILYVAYNMDVKNYKNSTIKEANYDIEKLENCVIF